MTSALNSHFGFALQTAKGTPNVTDTAYHYQFFSEGTGIEPEPMYLPLDQEIGSGQLIRDVKAVGVVGRGQFRFIPRPNFLGYLLLGALGQVTNTAPTGQLTTATHLFDFQANQFNLPYFTMRRRISAGNFGDIVPDCRIETLQIEAKAANFVRGTCSVLGAGMPSITNTPDAWNAATYLDASDPFLTCKGTVELPTGTGLTLLEASITMANQMPLDEQMVIGHYTPDDIEVVMRSITVQFTAKVKDISLYQKMKYGQTGSGSITYPASWLPNVYREAALNLTFQSERENDPGVPSSITIAANGSSGANSNIAWSCQPIGLRGNNQVVLSFSGTVLADNTAAAAGPFSVTLHNTKTSYAT